MVRDAGIFWDSSKLGTYRKVGMKETGL